MGFRSGVPVVGLRTYFVFAISLGMFIGIVGLMGILRNSGGAAPEAEDPRPDIVLLGIDHLTHDFAIDALPEFATLMSPGLRAINAYGRVSSHDLEELRVRLVQSGYTTARWEPSASGLSFREVISPIPSPVFLTVDCDRDAVGFETRMQELRQGLSSRTESRSAAILAGHFSSAGEAVELTPPEGWHVPLLLSYSDALPITVEMTQPVWAADVLQTIAHISGLEQSPASRTEPSSLLSMRIAATYHDIAVVQDGDRICGGSDDEWVCTNASSAKPTFAPLPGRLASPAVEQALTAAIQSFR